MNLINETRWVLPKAFESEGYAKKSEATIRTIDEEKQNVLLKEEECTEENKNQESTCHNGLDIPHSGNCFGGVFNPRVLHGRKHLR